MKIAKVKAAVQRKYPSADRSRFSKPQQQFQAQFLPAAAAPAARPAVTTRGASTSTAVDLTESAPTDSAPTDPNVLIADSMADISINADELIMSEEDWQQTINEWFDELDADNDSSSSSAELSDAPVKCGTLAQIFQATLEPLNLADW